MERDPQFDPHAVEATFQARGTVVYLDLGRTNTGTYDKVAIDLGTEDGILPGDHFLAFRQRLDDALYLEREVIGGGFWHARKRAIPVALADEIYANAFPNEGLALGGGRRKSWSELRGLATPARYLAELVVLDAQPSVSTAMIVYAEKEVLIGDQVELKAGEAPKP
jgi:hypothetical protein